MIHTKKCKICKEELPHKDFYKQVKSTDGLQNKCKQCESRRGSSRAYRRVDEWERRGGKCERCNITADPMFFDFHHVDPDTKEIPINKIWYMGAEKRVLELKKCVMVCPNCHRELHMELGTFGLNNAAKRKLKEEAARRDTLKDKTT